MTLEVLAAKFEAHERRFDELRQSDETKLQLQAREYERRLNDLNHAHRDTQQRNADYISREVFDAKITAMEIKQQALERLVYVGLGVLLVLNGAIGLFVSAVK